MKNILTILSISLLSATAYAESISQDIIAITIQPETSISSDLILAKKADSSLNLWETLDTNKDGSLSKTEAASSEKVLASWDILDTNKDQLLSTEEFAHMFVLEN